MTVNQVRVKAKPVAARGRSSLHLWLLGSLVAAAVVAALVYDWDSGALGLLPQGLEIVNNGATKTIKVHPGGNVQAALEQAESGDVIELQAGAVYSGELRLPNKPLTDFVTIRSSAADSLPPGVRVTPAQKGSMAVIQSGILGRAAVSATGGANHYRFVGIEFRPSGSMYNYGLLILGKGERADQVPHDIEIDRSYIHPYTSGKLRRGIALNSANTTIQNSYIEGIAFPSEETQGICGWSGSRNIKIYNNYIEAGAENIMFGGADPASADLIPSNIEIRGNYLNKPAEWVGKNTIKTLFELKDAKHVTFTGNLMTNNWSGSAFRITVRDQDGGAPFSTIEDVTIRDNVLDGAAEGINILGKDDTYPSGTLKGLTITNNLFTRVMNGNGFDGSGYFVQIADGEEVTIANNTVMNHGNIVTFYGAMPRGFIFRDNITGHGSYGVHGLNDIRSGEARSMFQNNIFINLNHVSPDDYSIPPGNTILRDIGEVGFVDASTGDYRVNNPKLGRVGCDLSTISPDLTRTLRK